MKKLHAALLGAILLGGVAACSPLPTLNALSPGSGLRSGSALAYGENARHKLDVYSPEDSGVAAPVVVFFLGGNWTKGEREDYAFVGRALAARGIVAVIPDFRLYPEVRYPDFLDDSARAVAWTVREIGRYGGDPARLFVMGHSSGAYNAAMMALDPQWLAKQGMQPAALRGWIGLAGPYDFLPIENKITQPVFHFPNTPPESQPINHARAGTPPALLIAANSDKLVDPVRNTGAMAARLRGKGVAVQELHFDKVSHATLVASMAAPLRFLAPTLNTVEQFVKSDAGRLVTASTTN
ncbi:esterase [Massilia violaceinigra]|uniref:Esterase n=1 Tax=Massilia violaceinigra TaxID=2045208 RepID=A0A2D2DM32_9BURK|nr:alpha/beta hydrolase [Massilia violaceinigra]ATQ76001.1 esterase [Massilia violaceinigra]